VKAGDLSRANKTTGGRMTKRLILALALSLTLAGSVSAQVATGNVYGTVTDETGSAVPAVAVTLAGEAGARATRTGSDGNFRFLGLTHGDYTLVLALTGFARVIRPVRVTTGESVDLSLTLKIAAVEETIEVVGETPLVDRKRRGTATTLTAEELSRVPNDRDPWAVLKAVPGVLLSSVNVAGSENGQRPGLVAKGGGEEMWSLDGLVVTDMSGIGSPSYYDFGAFEEIAVTTGGNDLMSQTGGISINLTTRRGTNAFHGSGRFLISHDDLSFGNVPDSLANDPRLLNPDGTRRDKADHIQQITDYGFEVGGPIVRDKLWFWGAWGRQDIRLVRLDGLPDKTLLPGTNAKVNWQMTSNTMVSGLYFRGEKEKYGRDPGYYGTIGEESFNYDQTNASVPGGLPGGLWKLQVDHTFSSNLFASAKVAYYDNGFALTPRGGTGQAWTIDFWDGVALGSSPEYVALHPQKQVAVDGSYFFNGLGGNHELKFGFAWRDYKVVSGATVGGSGLVGYLETQNTGYVEIPRSGPSEYTGRYWSAYLGDMFSKGRLTLNAGLRWDLQSARNSPATVDANVSFPDLVPALVYPGDRHDVVEWNTLSPRVGLSYALNESRRSVLRASYAYYAAQLPFSVVYETNPVSYGAVAYGWTDLDGDKFVQPDEIDFGDFWYSYGIDPTDPAQAVSPNRIDADWAPQYAHEVVVGIDHELAPGFALGAAYTWRRSSDRGYRPWLAGPCPMEDPVGCRIVEPAEYSANSPATANGYTAFTYSAPSALVAAGGGGRIHTNRPGYATSFNGFELTLTKRLAKRWMARVAFSWNDWVEDFDTAIPVSDLGNPTSLEWDPLKDGGQVTAIAGLGGKQSVFTSVKWQLYANGLWQGPWGLELSGALFARQGTPYPVSLQLSAGADGTLATLATDQVDSYRFDDLWDLDLRLARTFQFSGSAGVTLSAEWFNVLNSGVVLARYRFANSAAFTDTAGGAVPGMGRIDQIIAPGIIRLGARLFF
jgi:hypothetical protein